MLENTASNRKQARLLHSSGRLDAARAAYEAMLSATPDDADLLGLLGALKAQQGELQTAQEMLHRSLSLEAEPRIDLRNLNNLGILQQAVGSDAEGLASGRPNVTDEAWIEMGGDLSDEEYNGRFLEWFGIQL